MALLRVENLTSVHKSGGGWFSRTPRIEIKAVDSVSLTLEEGRTVGIAGETGCGKTSLALTLLRIVAPSGGSVYFTERPIFRMSHRRFRRLRGDLQMIFSHPNEAFRPGWTVRRLFQEVLRLHQRELGRQESKDRVEQLLETVGLSGDCLQLFPRELNLFDRQRVCIARILAAQPRLLICDDPTRYLDTVSQARILDILKDIQVSRRITLLYLARDYAVVEHMSDQIHVMNRGRFVESGTPDELFHSARHECTRQLLALSGAT
ncbi:MAG: peptide/nickel transport system ATP-binding protein [Verrucomicrobia bacterium]|nr:MAG: peptide/nickel transport system ATP-binding protein [Verrucomicrobiota bacterium]